MKIRTKGVKESAEIKKESMDNRGSVETGWTRISLASIMLLEIQSSPPMLPRFFIRIRVQKWLKCVWKRCKNPLNVAQDLFPQDCFEKQTFLIYRSHARACSIELKSCILYLMSVLELTGPCSSLLPKCWYWSSLPEVHAQAWGSKLELAPKMMNYFFSSLRSSYLQFKRPKWVRKLLKIHKTF